MVRGSRAMQQARQVSLQVAAAACSRVRAAQCARRGAVLLCEAAQCSRALSSPSPCL